MILFNNDYSEGAHPAILKKLEEINFEQNTGYGMDKYSEEARNHIRRVCSSPDMDVHFIAGGTLTNLIVVSSALRPHEGVISANTGHINVHETGAIENTGHKVLVIDSEDGKIKPAMVEKMCQAHYEDGDREHTVKPGMVYISNPTELGTIYLKRELDELREVCNKYNLYLFLDGARLGYGLCAEENDLTMADIASLCDVFYIGGTKVGALFGEAVCITNTNLKKEFRYLIKQKGALLAKGWIMGIMFLVLFEDSLYFKIADNAVKMAMRIKEAFNNKGIDFYCDSPTNQQFPILDNLQYDILKEKYLFSYIAKIDDNRHVVRFCTSFATRPENVYMLVRDIEKL